MRKTILIQIKILIYNIKIHHMMFHVAYWRSIPIQKPQLWQINYQRLIEILINHK